MADDAYSTADTRREGARPSIPTVLGVVLLAAAGADLHGIATSSADDWPRVARAEVALLGGLWLFSGFRPRRARAAVLTAAAVVLAWDFARALTGLPPRPAFGPAHAPAWLSLVVVVAWSVFRWRPGSEEGGGSAWRTAAGAAALVAGAAFDWSQVGAYPIAASVRSAGLSVPPGLDYWVYLPDGYYTSLGRRPLILVLHGSGLVGCDVERVRTGGLPRRLERGGRVPFVVVAPQCPKPGWDVDALDLLLDDVLKRWRIDADRVYLTGESMGGRGVWELAAARPDRFAAAAPICGWGVTDWAGRLAELPIRAFHGDEDDVVPLEKSREMVEAVHRRGGEAELMIYPGVGHDSWTRTYEDPDLYEWFLAHRRRMQ